MPQERPILENVEVSVWMRETGIRHHEKALREAPNHLAALLMCALRVAQDTTCAFVKSATTGTLSAHSPCVYHRQHPSHEEVVPEWASASAAPSYPHEV